MLRYIITLCLICFCNATPGRVGMYSEMVLVQHWSTTSFAWQQNNTRNSVEYLPQNGGIFDSNKWILHGLWPMNINNEYLTYCKTASGSSPTYTDNSLSSDFKNVLRTKWPSFNEDVDEDSLWGSVYDKHGSCISVQPSFYFLTAMGLLHDYNVANMFAESNISVGPNYHLDRIVEAITDRFGAAPYVKCIPAQDPTKQYLVEVHLCLTRTQDSIDCHHTSSASAIEDCSSDKDIIYS